MNDITNINSFVEYVVGLDKKSRILLFALIAAVVLSLFSGRTGGHRLSYFPPDTTYYTNFYADGHMKTSSDGKSITWFPYNQVFPVTYTLHGHSIYGEYGRVADVTIRKNSITIRNCSTDYLRSMIGHTWKQ